MELTLIDQSGDQINMICDGQELRAELVACKTPSEEFIKEALRK